MPDFKLRPLHRRRHGRRKRVEVLNQQELAERLGLEGVDCAQLRRRLDQLGWHYHTDSAGRLWATLPADAPAGKH
jgi:hypothetical protein